MACLSVYFCMRNCFAYVVKHRRLCVYIFSTTIAGVSLCGKLYFRHYFCEFMFTSDGVDFAGCSCIMKAYVNV